MLLLVVWLAIIVVAFYALIVRPQRRQVQAMRALQDSLAEGDEVVTTSGIHGRVRGLDETTVRLEIAPGTVITIARAAIGARGGQQGTGDGADDDGDDHGVAGG